MKDNQDHFEILRKIKKKPQSSQRELAQELGFSLGKLNYCLKELQKKGYKFKSHSDSEVVLYSLCEWKEKALLKFNGMFAQ